MIFDKKNLFFGIIIGIAGNSLYNSIKKQKNFRYIKEYTLNHPINNDGNFPKSSKNDLQKQFNQLKKQTNLLEEKLNKLRICKIL